jgi:dCTP deaminase
MILSAQTIRRYCHMFKMVSPFNERTISNGKTFGLGAAGYDVRVEFKVGNMHRFSAPRYFHWDGFYEPGHRFALASTVEEFNMPHNVRGVVHDKSSWIRKGLTLGNTVIEPGWRGFLTLELIYHGKDELIVWEGDPIAQIAFEFLDEPTEQPYVGKYQNQPRGPQEAIEETS